MKKIKYGITSDKLYLILSKEVKEWGRDSDIGSDIWDWMVAYLDTENEDKPLSSKTVDSINELLEKYDLFESTRYKSKLTTIQKLRKIIREEYRKTIIETVWNNNTIESLFDLLGQEEWTEVIPNKSGYTTGKSGLIDYLITPQYLSLTFADAHKARNACTTLQKKFDCSVFSDSKPETLIVR